MKTIVMKCDHCKNEILGDFIEIGSANGKELTYNNTFKNVDLHNLFGHRDLHFCSKDHFVEFFFGLNYGKKGCEPEQQYCKCWNTDGMSTANGIVCLKCNLIKP